MQALNLFAAMVLAVGAAQLLDRLVTRLRGSGAASRTHDATERRGRSDWYVFFSCSSLYGTKTPLDASRQSGRRNDQAGDTATRPTTRRRPRATV